MDVRSNKPWKGSRELLSYTCKLLSRRKEDAPRLFILALDVGTEEISLSEVPQPTFGIPGGPALLKPTKVPFVEPGVMPWRGRGVGAAPEMDMGASSRWLGPTDLYVGAKVDVMARQYEVVSCDPATHVFMERYPEQFPGSDANVLLHKLQGKCNGRGSSMRTCDP
jgi:hypothetical protein